MPGAATLLFAGLLVMPAAASARDGDTGHFKVEDPALEIRLFAAAPDIVTPIGIAADGRNRVFVVESHTHHREPDYPGPARDRVKVLTDADGDGRADRVHVFADGLRYAMNARFSPQRELYVTQRDGVAVLYDRDDDGVSESRDTIVTLKTHVTYVHDSIHGIAFGPDGWLYLGFGYNQGAQYTLTGSDGTQLRGAGKGGFVFRCRPDGSALQRFAMGFWNPFALAFDRAGRLFCVDNDPDARAPCRLLHVIDQGDYGFRFEYGRDGLHPFVAWDGELPGTLPMVAGTGEAPSGILDCEAARLPANYRDTLLVTAWGDNRIERFRLLPRGASFRARRTIAVQGDKSFWPVGIAAGADGAIYISDWTVKDYPVHGKGRIWRLSTRPGKDVREPARQAASANSPGATQMHRLVDASKRKQFRQLTDALSDADPFIRAAAVRSLARPVFHDLLLTALNHDDPAVRLGVLLALRRADHADAADVLQKCLADPDEQVRLMTLVWIGETYRTALSGELEVALTAGAITPRLFHAYLGAIGRLEHGPFKPENPDDVLVRRPGLSSTALIARYLVDPTKPAAVRALSAVMVPDPDDERVAPALLALVRKADPDLRMEAIRTVASSTQPEAISAIRDVAHDRAAPAEVRAEAVAALADKPESILTGLVELLDDPEAEVQVETVRSLRRLADRRPVRDRLVQAYRSVRNVPSQRAMAEQLRFTLYPPGSTSTSIEPSNPQRPASDAEWRQALRRPGDARSGRRIFFHAAVGCGTCHRVHGRGGRVGPDLSAVGRASDRDKLITSILSPSQDIAPGYTQHAIRTTNDEVHLGLLAPGSIDGSVTLTTATAATITIPADEVLEQRETNTSVMPDGLEQTLTVQNFRDLLEYLLSRK